MAQVQGQKNLQISIGSGCTRKNGITLKLKQVGGTEFRRRRREGIEGLKRHQELGRSRRSAAEVNRGKTSLLWLLCLLQLPCSLIRINPSAELVPFLPPQLPKDAVGADEVPLIYIAKGQT